MEKFTVKNGKKLKYGFTTGSCAAAAAAAAAAMLFSGEKVSETEIILPAGEKMTLTRPTERQSRHVSAEHPLRRERRQKPESRLRCWEETASVSLLQRVCSVV